MERANKLAGPHKPELIGGLEPTQITFLGGTEICRTHLFAVVKGGIGFAVQSCAKERFKKTQVSKKSVNKFFIRR